MIEKEELLEKVTEKDCQMVDKIMEVIDGAMPEAETKEEYVYFVMKSALNLSIALSTLLCALGDKAVSLSAAEFIFQKIKDNVEEGIEALKKENKEVKLK